MDLLRPLSRVSFAVLFIVSISFATTSFQNSSSADFILEEDNFHPFEAAKDANCKCDAFTTSTDKTGHRTRGQLINRVARLDAGQSCANDTALVRRCFFLCYTTIYNETDGGDLFYRADNKTVGQRLCDGLKQDIPSPGIEVAYFFTYCHLLPYQEFFTASQRLCCDANYAHHWCY